MRGPIARAMASGTVTALLALGACGFPRPTGALPADGASDAAEPIDASLDASGDASPEPRCDPAKPFGSPMPLSLFNTAFDEFSLTLSRDERTAFLGRGSSSNPQTTITVATRNSIAEPFGTPVITSAVAALNNASGNEFSAWPTGDTLVLYFHRETVAPSTIGVFAAIRSSTQNDFDAGLPVSVAGAALFDALSPVISADGQTLYWLDLQQFQFHAALRAQDPMNFGPATLASAVQMLHPVLSRDELTLYYSDTAAGDIFVSTRSSTGVAFTAGALVPDINSAEHDVPEFLTEDGCILYLASTRFGGGGGGYDLWEARRPR